MTQISSDENPKTPGIISALGNGFELTTKYFWLMIIPVVLDIFYWLGPRLSINELWSEIVSIMAAEIDNTALIESMTYLVSETNLFTTLSVPIIGVPTLMAAFIPDGTPIATQSYEITNSVGVFFIPLILSFIGLILTTIYLSLISWALRIDSGDVFPGIYNFAALFSRALIRLVGLAIAFTFVFFLVSLLMFPIAFILGLIDFVFFTATFLIAFLIIASYLSLAAPGIIYNNRPMFKSIIESIRVVYRNMLPTIGLLSFVLVAIFFTNEIMRRVDDGSWLTIFSILGHAFISTGLIAAIFIFYRDRYALFVEAESSTTRGEQANG